jgi:hypothetical protein
MRMLIAAAVTIAMLALALPAFAQGEAFCDWYWDYRFNSLGGWEYWCWDPQLGWWYGESEEGTSRSVRLIY